MSILFEDRERAAEFGFVREEELRFLATREAIGVLAAWAAERIGLDNAEGAAYADRLIGALAGGAIEPDIVAAVGADVERADRKAQNPVGQARAVLARAMAEATAKRHAPPPHAVPPAPIMPANHRHAFWGWTV